ETARHTLGQVTAAHVDLADFLAGLGTADFLLDALGRGVTYEAAVVAAHVGGDRFVQTVATDTDRFGVDDATQRDDGDFGGPAADVDYHGAAGLVHRQAGTDGRCHGLFDQTDFTRAGTHHGFADGAALD